MYQRSLSLGTQRAPGRTRAHARESRRVVSAHVAPLGCEGRARACMNTHTHTHYLVDPASSICLSQRLSHACLSTSRSYGETANGSINQLWFLRTVNPTWITVVILELIHAPKPRLGWQHSRKGAFIRSKPVGRARPSRTSLVTLDNFTLIARPPRRRRFFQMSALSTVDGRLRAYHGCNG